MYTSPYNAYQPGTRQGSCRVFLPMLALNEDYVVQASSLGCKERRYLSVDERCETTRVSTWNVPKASCRWQVVPKAGQEGEFLLRSTIRSSAAPYCPFHFLSSTGGNTR